jgi:hypothetical protein
MAEFWSKWHFDHVDTSYYITMFHCNWQFEVYNHIYVIVMYMYLKETICYMLLLYIEYAIIVNLW